jgi:hypothetical protein
MELAEQHVSMLESRVTKFRAVGTIRREKIVEEAADHIERTWTEDIEFNRGTMINVRRLSAKLGHSHIFSSSFANICTANLDGGPINPPSILEGGRTST